MITCHQDGVMGKEWSATIDHFLSLAIQRPAGSSSCHPVGKEKSETRSFEVTMKCKIGSTLMGDPRGIWDRFNGWHREREVSPIARRAERVTELLPAWGLRC